MNWSFLAGAFLGVVLWQVVKFVCEAIDRRLCLDRMGRALGDMPLATLTERERRDLIDADIRQDEIERALEMARERDGV